MSVMDILQKVDLEQYVDKCPYEHRLSCWQ